jgi:hypothetical protein
MNAVSVTNAGEREQDSRRWLRRRWSDTSRSVPGAFAAPEFSTPASNPKNAPSGLLKAAGTARVTYHFLRVQPTVGNLFPLPSDFDIDRPHSSF